MKRLSFYIMVIIIGFSSCRKEELSEINIIKTEEPTEIDGVLFQGIVKNGNIKIADADIQVFQNELLVGKIKTDENGKFNTASLKLEPESHVTFYVKKEGFPYQAKRKIKFDKISEINFNLQPNNDTLKITEDIANPGSNNFHAISGYIIDNDQKPVYNAIVFAYYDSIPHPHIPDKQKYIGIYTATDETGKYEILVPENKMIILSAFQENCTTGNPPYFNGSFRFHSVFKKNIGSFNNNAQIENIITNYQVLNTTERVRLTGIALNCAGNKILNGQVKLQFNFDDQIMIWEDTPIRNGEFTYEKYFCRPINRDVPVKILIKTVDPYNIQESNWIELKNDFEITKDLTIQSCISSDSPYYTLNIDNKSLSFTLAEGIVFNDTLRASKYWAAISNWFNFQISQPKIGENYVHQFTYNVSPNSQNEDIVLIQDGQEIIANIIKLENNIYEGTFYGKAKHVLNGGNKIVNINGKFRIKI